MGRRSFPAAHVLSTERNLLKDQYCGRCGGNVVPLGPVSDEEAAVALGAIFDVPGMTQAQYEQVKDQVAPGNQPPPGLLYHAGGPSAGGWTVIEVWESQEALDRMFQERIGPALQRLGATAQPRFFDVVNTMS